MRAALTLGCVLLASCASPGSGPANDEIAAVIEGDFEQTCGIANPTPLRVRDAALAAGWVELPRDDQRDRVRMLMWPSGDATLRTVELTDTDAGFRCLVAHQHDDPEGVASLLADSLRQRGGVDLGNSDGSLEDCHQLRLDGISYGACVVDWSPHGISAALRATFPTSISPVPNSPQPS